MKQNNIMDSTDNKEIKNTIAEYFDQLYEMGIPMQLKPFGKGYRLEIGNIHIYFENKDLTYTGWGIDLSGGQENEHNLLS